VEASEFRDAKKQFDKLNVVILGASGDPVKTQAAFKDKYKLNFPLLSDPEFTMIEAYGARCMKKFLGKSFLGIVRSSFLIGADGKIEHVWDNVKAKGHAAEALAVASERNGSLPAAAAKRS
jgi:thioredoxin-dependent peroxiredoxin